MGEKAAYTILNVLGKGLQGGRHLPDRLDVGAKKQQHYKVSLVSFQHRNFQGFFNLFRRIVTCPLVLR
jgi:hypothetical protein